MKTIIQIIILLIVFSGAATAQTKEAKIEVKGNCGMCKERIEEAAMRTAGVKQATWDKATMQLTVVYNEKKTTVEAISEAVAQSGHATAMHEKSDAQYKKLPDCCQYEHGGCQHKD